MTISRWGRGSVLGRGVVLLALTGCGLDDGLEALEEPSRPAQSGAELTGRIDASPRIPGFDLTIERSGNDLVIACARHLGSPSYALWQSTDPYFTPGDPGSSLVAAGASPSFTVAGAATLATARYWRIVVDESDELTTSTTVGAWVQPLVPGYNILSFPLLDTGVLGAQALAAAQPGLSEIWVFNAERGGFDGWFGTGEANLAWEAGEAVMVTYVGAGPTMHRQLGHVPLTSDVDRTLDVGLNLVTVPLAVPPLDASTLAASIPTLDQMGSWNAETQVLDVFGPPSWGVDFHVSPGQGLWLWSTAPGPWPPAGTVAVCGDGVLASPETCDDGDLDDGDGCDATCVLTPPSLGADAYAAAQGTPLAVAAPQGLTSNDAAYDGSGVVVLAADAQSEHGGQLTVSVDGAFQYVPPVNFWGEDGFTYTVVDAWGATAEREVELVVRPTAIPLAVVRGGFGGFAIEGAAQQDFVGNPAGGGDVNGDGLHDVLVGTSSRTFNGIGSAGRVYVVFGRTETTSISIASIAAGIGGFVLDPRPLSGGLGSSVSFLGDLDGDRFDEFVASAPSAYLRGEAYVVRGRTETTPVSATNVAAGFGGYLVSAEAANSRLAWATGAGDVNGDGLPDVVATDTESALGGGAVQSAFDRSYVVFGQAGTTPVSTASVAAGVGGFRIDNHSTNNEHTMTAVSGAGDVNGDGFHDVVLGAAYANFAGAGSGRTWVVFGKPDTAPVSLAALGAGGFTIDGELAGDNAGYWVRAAGDVNGDGLDDVIVGAWAADPHGLASGSAYVVFGKLDAAPVNLDDVAAGIGGFVLHGVAASDYTSQRAAAGVGDVNGDGLDDVAVGARLSSANGNWSGRGYVVYGKTDTEAVELSEVAVGIGGFSLVAEGASHQLGSAIAAGGDVNGDGFADVLIAAPQAQPNGWGSGRVYVVFGSPSAP